MTMKCLDYVRTRLGALPAFGMAVVLVFAASPPSALAEASAWVEGMHNRARLIAGRVEAGGDPATLMAGIHLQLEPGWHTYWRYPGDSGLPPLFDWSDSRNLDKAEVLWPAPTRFSDPFGTSIGYKREVVFPVEITPARPDEAVELKLKLEYAVCKDICIPAEAAMKLTIPAGAEILKKPVPLIARYLGRVPREDAAASNDAAPSIRHKEAQLSGSAPHLMVETRFPDKGEGADLFIEGPEGMYLPAPEVAAKSPEGDVKFKVDLSKADDPASLAGKTLTLTLVSRNAQSEARWRIE